MTVAELIEELTEVADAGFGDLEVLLAHQPSWPLAFTVSCIATPEDIEPEDQPVVWIAAGAHPIGRSPYAPSNAWVA